MISLCIVIVIPLLQDFSGQFLIAALVLGLLILLGLFVWNKKSGKRGRTVLLTGICDSGKTSIFAWLTASKAADTYTSATPNEALVTIKGSKNSNSLAEIRLVDVPGHEKVRGKYFDDLKTSTLAIIFVVDSTSLGKRLRDVAECLHFILTNDDVQRRSIPVAVACHKQDSSLAKRASIVQSELEKELRLLSSARVKNLDGCATKKKTIIDPDQVSFLETSIIEDHDGEYSVNQIFSFLNASVLK